jgi:anti-sigma B factor antagonist
VRAFRVAERDLDGECREIRVEGELDLSVAEQLQERLDLAAKGGVDVLVCLDKCDFVDSSGIAALVLAHKLIASRGRRLFVCHPTSQVHRILTLTGLTGDGLVFDCADGTLTERFGHVAGLPRESPQEP